MAKPARNAGRGRGRPPNSARAGPPQQNTLFDANRNTQRPPQGKKLLGRGFSRSPLGRSEIDLDWRSHSSPDNDEIKEDTQTKQAKLKLDITTMKNKAQEEVEEATADVFTTTTDAMKADTNKGKTEDSQRKGQDQ